MDVTGRGRNAFLTAVGVLVALGLVAVTSRGSTSSGSGGARRPTDTLLDILLSLYIVALIAGALLFIYLLALRRSALMQSGGRSQRNLRTIIGVLALALAALLLARDRAGRQFDSPITIPQAPGLGGWVPTTSSQQQQYEAEFAWIPVLSTLALIGLAVAGFWWSERSRRRARGELSGSLLADAIAEAVDESLDGLRAEPDPRRAVIAAYARLERVLAAHGLPRDPAEAPFEYLRRMLAGLSVSPAAARTLTDLFERAKFSQHAVEPEMKEQAIHALETVRDDLLAARALAEQERAAELEALGKRAAVQ